MQTMRGYLKSTGGLYQLSLKTTTVGREGCDLNVQSSTVDRQHAVIDYVEHGDSFVLQDLNTAYGTYVNDCRIGNSAVRLFSGDVIRFGNSNILFEFVASSEPALTCPPVHRQSAWQPLTLITDQDVYPSNTLPHLRSVVATTTQTFATPPVVQQQQLPKPPTSVRSRPLSAGSRHRHVVDRTCAVPPSSTTEPLVRNGGAWVRGGPGLLRSSSSNDLRTAEDQDDRRMTWLKDEVQRLSCFETECQHKEELINQLYHEIELLQRRQSTPVNQGYPDVNVADKLSVLENELIAKRLEIDELKQQIQHVHLLRNTHHTVNDANEFHRLRTKLEQAQHEKEVTSMQLTESQNLASRQGEELEQLRKEIDKLKQMVQEKDTQLNKAMEDIATRDRQLNELQQKLDSATSDSDVQNSLIGDLKQQIDKIQSELSAANESHHRLQLELETHKGTYREMEYSKSDLLRELNSLTSKLETFRLQIKQAVCYVSDTSTSSADDEDNDVIQTIKHITSERATFRAKVQKLKEKSSAHKLLSKNIEQTKERLKETLESLNAHGLLSQDVKLEIAALQSVMRQQTVDDAITSMFIKLMEMMSAWEADIQSALEDCNIDVQHSHEAPSHHIRSLQNQLVQRRQESSQLLATIDQLKQDHQIVLKQLQDDFDAKTRQASVAYEQQQTQAVADAVAVEKTKHETTIQLNEAKIRTLEAELDQLKQSQRSKDASESQLQSQVAELNLAIDTFRQTEVILRQKISELEADHKELTSRLNVQLTSSSHEKKQYEEQISEHARTICALEDQLDKIASKAKEYQAEITSLKATVQELSARPLQPSPPPVHRKLVVQPVQTSLDVAAMGQLQRDNVDLKRQLHEQNDTIMALRRDLAGATARLSDVTGEVSEAQKMELERNRLTIEQQQADLTELRQQLAKLSEIVDRQTDDMKQLNLEANKHKAALTKYKNKLNEKEARLKETEQGLVKVKKESSTKLSAAEDEGRIQAELALAGAQCRGERHEQVIARQRDALIELRAKIKVLESGNLPAMTHDEAVQELIILRQQIAELRSASSTADPLGLVRLPSQALAPHFGGVDALEMTLPELSEAFEFSENLYLSLVRALGSVLELENLTRMKSLAHVGRGEKRVLVAEREQELERIVSTVRLLKERIERKDQLLQGYEHDLAKLRHAEDLTELTSSQKDSLMADLRKKSEEVECLRESLLKTKERLEQEKRLNGSIKQKKTFHLENEKVVQANNWPKHQCLPEERQTSSASGKKQSQNEKLKRKNYEIKLLHDELRSRRSEISQRRAAAAAAAAIDLRD